MMFEALMGKEMPAPEDKRTVEERLTDIETAIKALSEQLAAVAQIARGNGIMPIPEATYLKAYGYSDERIKQVTYQVQGLRSPSP
jgi:fructose-bisphosphate aldolase class 1